VVVNLHLPKQHVLASLELDPLHPSDPIVWLEHFCLRSLEVVQPGITGLQLLSLLGDGVQKLSVLGFF
jgi:hypothetical protein